MISRYINGTKGELGFKQKSNGLLVIGDVHGKLSKYFSVVKEAEENDMATIQIGDFGFDFEHGRFIDKIDVASNKVLLGNHDDYTYLKAGHSLGDYSVIDIGGTKIMAIRGAFSIDRHLRTEGIDWWREEELSMAEMNDALAIYLATKPSIVITHDCPKIVSDRFSPYFQKTRTGQFLDAVFDYHKPDLWVFGHHHRDEDFKIDGTRFVCLDELSTFRIEVDEKK